MTLFAPFSFTMVSNPLVLPLISLYETFLDSSTMRDEISKVFHVKALIAPRIWVEINKKKKIPGRNIFAAEGHSLLDTLPGLRSHPHFIETPKTSTKPNLATILLKGRLAIPRIPINSVLWCPSRRQTGRSSGRWCFCCVLCNLYNAISLYRHKISPPITLRWLVDNTLILRSWTKPPCVEL